MPTPRSNRPSKPKPPAARTVLVQSPHRDLQVTYAMAPNARATVAAVLEPMLWIVPPWCRALHISVEPQSRGNMACCTVDDEYRQAAVQLDPEWLAQEDDKQRRYLCHELCHILLEPVGNFGNRLLEALREQLDDPSYTLMHAEWVRSVEMVTNDLDRTLAMVGCEADKAVRA